MILELAILHIKEEESSAFEQSLEKAQAVIQQAEGYLGHQFQQCIEEPNKYILLIHWQSVEAHEEGFRKSALFTEWRGLIGTYFAAPPEVQHYQMKFEHNL
ncbi:MAG: antibiotic biosynthesis monooxygenase [Bacteroidota bacterium]